MIYDQDILSEVKESMRLPWMKRPFYSTKAQDTTPKGVRIERRSPALSKRLRRFWYHVADAMGIFGFLLLGLSVAVLIVMAAIGVESLFR